MANVLQAAIARGNVDMVKKILKQKPDLEASVRMSVGNSLIILILLVLLCLYFVHVWSIQVYI